MLLALPPVLSQLRAEVTTYVSMGAVSGGEVPLLGRTEK